MIDIVIDIETLGTRPGCPVIEIGACAVDPDGGAIVGNFSRRLSGTYCFRDVRSVAEGTDCLGGVDRGTALWWMLDTDRKETLRRILSRPYGPSCDTDALIAFADWFREVRDIDDVRVWGNGPTFDLSILSEACRIEHIPTPWDYREERCVRTALEMSGYERGSVAWEEAGPRHRALNDARHEAKKLWRSGALGTVSEVTKRLRQLGTVGKEVKSKKEEGRRMNAQRLS